MREKFYYPEEYSEQMNKADIIEVKRILDDKIDEHEIEEGFNASVNIVDDASFKIFCRGIFSKDFDNAVTPAVTLFNPSDKQITAIVINESFLSDDDEFEYVQLLLRHEIIEASFLKDSDDYLNSLAEDRDAGRELDPTAHIFAIGAEYRLAQDLGILEQYHQHWIGWLESSISQVISDIAKEATRKRIMQREIVYEQVTSNEKIRSQEAA